MSNIIKYVVKVHEYWKTTTKKERFNNFDECKAYADTIEDSRKHDKSYSEISLYDYVGYTIIKKEYKKDTPVLINEEVVFKSNFYTEIEKKREDYIIERNKIREKNEEKRKRKRAELLESWGITEEDIKKRDYAKEVERYFDYKKLNLLKKELEESKNYLKDVLFNYERIIEAARQNVADRTRDLDNFLNNPGKYAVYEKWTKVGEEVLSMDNINRLWDLAGGKSRWKNIDLKKKGPYIHNKEGK